VPFATHGATVQVAVVLVVAMLKVVVVTLLTVLEWRFAK
jgi:hypothetical protein